MADRWTDRQDTRCSPLRWLHKKWNCHAWRTIFKVSSH